MLRKNQIEKKSTLHSGRKSVQIPHHPRAIGRSENPGMPALFGGHNLPPTLIETGLTNLQKSGGGMCSSLYKTDIHE